MGQNTHLRQPTSDDIDRMVEIENRCFPPLRRFDRTYLTLCISNLFCLVVEFNGVVIGFAICRAQEGQKHAYLETLSVHPDFRKNGVASVLMTSVEHTLAAVGATEMQLHVHETNEAAIALYKKRGYAITSLTEHFYRDGANAFAMSKPLMKESS